MRLFWTALLACITFAPSATAQEQTETPTALPTVSYTQIADGRSEDLPKGFIQTYETEFGYTVSVGDIVAVNVPTGQAGYAVGASAGAYNGRAAGGVSTSRSVSTQYFQYIYNGTYNATVGKMVLAGLGGGADPTIYQAPGRLSGSEIQVARIKLGGTKKRPVIWMECDLVNSREKANFSGTITISDYDQATRAGEIYNPKYISRDIAIQRLKDAKEMFDIGVFTQEQFDAEKAKYAPYLAQ